MNKKTFLRGFGTGVLFTAIILGISCFIRTSDSSTISRAKKLGMVFESETSKIVLATPEISEVTKIPDESAVPTILPSETEVPADTQAPDKTEAPAVSKETKAPSGSSASKAERPDKKLEEEKKNIEDEVNKEVESIRKEFTINDGDWGEKVSSKLEDMGIVDSASKFNKYLEDNGYSGVIRSGTYDLSPDDTYKEIAEKITSGR